MTTLTKYNAKEVLANTLKRFCLTTGKGIAAVFTWHGKLAYIGPENFQGLLNEMKDETWKSLTSFTSKKQIDTTKPVQDQCMVEHLNGNLKTTTRRVEVDVSDDLLSETDQSDIDLSSEPFFPF